MMWTSRLILVRTAEPSLVSPVKYIGKIVYSHKSNWFEPIPHTETGATHWQIIVSGACEVKKLFLIKLDEQLVSKQITCSVASKLSCTIAVI